MRRKVVQWSVPKALPLVIPAEHLAGAVGDITGDAFGLEAEALLFLLDAAGLRASAASSCSSGAQDPSHVLAAMGVDRMVAQGSLRLSLGHTSTDADVDAAIEIIPPAVERLRAHGGG